MQRHTVKAVSDDVEQCIKSVSCTVLLPSDSLVDLEQCWNHVGGLHLEPCGWTVSHVHGLYLESCGQTMNHMDSECHKNPLLEGVGLEPMRGFSSL